MLNTAPATETKAEKATPKIVEPTLFDHGEHPGERVAEVGAVVRAAERDRDELGEGDVLVLHRT